MENEQNANEGISQEEGISESNKMSFRAENIDRLQIDDHTGNVYMHVIDDKDFKEPASKLLKKINLTKGARFESSRRHADSFRNSNLSIVVLSLYVLTITSVSVIFPSYLTDLGSQALGLLAIVMSSFIIVFSILENAKSHELKSEMFLKCAQELSNIANELEARILVDEVGEEQYFDYSKWYNKVLITYSDNHADLDFKKYSSKKSVYYKMKRLEEGVVSYIKWALHASIVNLHWWASTKKSFLFALFIPWAIIILSYLFGTLIMGVRFGEVAPLLFKSL